MAVLGSFNCITKFKISAVKHIELNLQQRKKGKTLNLFPKYGSESCSYVLSVPVYFVLWVYLPNISVLNISSTASSHWKTAHPYFGIAQDQYRVWMQQQHNKL